MSPEKQRIAIKAAFRLAINKSKTLTEARRINKIRSRLLSGQMDETEAMIAWIELTTEVKKTLGDSKGQRRAA